MVPDSMSADFSRLCQSLLARDPVYGRLMNEETPPIYDGLSELGFAYEQENTPFLLGPRARTGNRTRN